MKTKLQILTAVLSLIFSMAMAFAQQPAVGTTAPATPMPINPQTGLPVGINPATGLPNGSPNLAAQSPRTHTEINPQTGLPEVVPDIDPATGLPADGSPPFKDSNGLPTWIAPSWEDPDKVLTSFRFSELPLSQMARTLQEQFTNSFDIIFPNTPGFDPTQIDVELELKNVKASEIFSAMNLQFELDKSPLRWELTRNGSRQTALLRDLPQLAPASMPLQNRKVFFVGDLLDDYPETNDAGKLNDISEIIQNGLSVAGIRPGVIKTYPSGQLLIVSGTPDQVDFAEQTLRALKEKAEYDKSHSRPQPANPQ